MSSVEHVFFFNDCIPTPVDKHIFLEKLLLTITEFNKLLEMEINVVRGIVTHKQPSLCVYGNNNYNLQEIIDLIEDKSMKDLAYSLFLKFPIGKPHFNDDFEELLTDSYKLIIRDEALNALNLAIVQKNNGILLSPAVVHELMSDIIKVSVENDVPIEIPNLFGQDDNTTIIRDIIVSRNQDNLDLFNKFLAIFENPKFTKQFRKDFENLSLNSKELTISCFKDAVSRKLPTKFSADGDLIKDVSPEKKKCDVFELRVRKDKELRVYFNESKNSIYFASIGFKNNNQQNQDIKSAHIALYKLILTN